MTTSGKSIFQNNTFLRGDLDMESATEAEVQAKVVLQRLKALMGVGFFDKIETVFYAPPGSGKTTFANRMNASGFVVYDTDRLPGVWKTDEGKVRVQPKTWSLESLFLSSKLGQPRILVTNVREVLDLFDEDLFKYTVIINKDEFASRVAKRLQSAIMKGDDVSVEIIKTSFQVWYDEVVKNPPTEWIAHEFPRNMEGYESWRRHQERIRVDVGDDVYELQTQQTLHDAENAPFDDDNGYLEWYEKYEEREFELCLMEMKAREEKESKSDEQTEESGEDGE
jgi:hypothetical protein